MNLPFGILIEADFGGGGFLFLLLLLLGFIIILLMNRARQNKQVPLGNWLNWVIPALRFAVLTILLLLVFNPELSLSRTYSVPKRLAVVIDESSSMKKAWEGEPRDLLASIGAVIDQLEETHSVDLFNMGGQPITSDEITFDKNISVFDWTPNRSNSGYKDNIYSSVFLFSDGHLNGGRSPLDMEWSKSLKINVVYPLLPKASSFLKLVNVGFEEIEQDGDPLLITGTIQQEGLIGRHATMEVLSISDQILGEEYFQLNQGFQEINIPIRLKGIASTDLKVKLFLDDGSFLTEQYLKISQKNINPSVLIVSERINALHKFLVESFSDTNYQVHIILGTKKAEQQSTQIFIPDKLDLIILNDPGQQVYQELSQIGFNLKAPIKSPTVLFYQGQEKLDPQWMQILHLGGISANTGSQSQTCFWNDTAKDHALYLGLLGRGFSASDLINYAPIVASNYHLKSDGEDLLLTGVGVSSSPAFSLRNQPPLAIFSGYGFWRWFFHPQSKSSFHTLWKYLLTYLDEIASFKPVQIILPVESAATGSFITAEVRVKDFDNHPIKAVELRAWQEGTSGKKNQLNITRSKTGAYEMQLDTKQPGDNLVIAEAYRFGELWGTDTSRIHLMNFNGEDQSRGVNEIFLARLAAQSQGTVIQYHEGDLPAIPVENVERESSFQFKGPHSMVLFSLLLTLLTLEWVLRRRNGLL